jgi:hypothetical protein
VVLMATFLDNDDPIWVDNDGYSVTVQYVRVSENVRAFQNWLTHPDIPGAYRWATSWEGRLEDLPVIRMVFSDRAAAMFFKLRWC